MPKFVFLPSLGYIDVSDIIQVYSPNGGPVDLDNTAESGLAVRFAAEVYDHNGRVNTHVVLLKDRTEIEFLVTALRLLAAPETVSDLSPASDLEALRSSTSKRVDSIGE